MSRCARSLLFSSAAARTGGVETRTRSVGAGGVRIKPSAALRCRVALPSDNPGSAGQPFQHQGPSHTPLLLTFSGSWERDCLVALSNALCLSIPGRDAAPLPKAKPSVSPICPLPLCHSSRDRAPCWPAPPDSTSTPVGTLAGRERERDGEIASTCACPARAMASREGRARHPDVLFGDLLDGGQERKIPTRMLCARFHASGAPGRIFVSPIRGRPVALMACEIE